MDNKKNPPLLHLYSPSSYHADGFIIGNRDGLEQLRDAIDQALLEDTSIKQVYVADGEGFNFFVQCIDEPWQNEKWQKLQLPYRDWEEYGPGIEDEKHPYELIGEEKYRQLVRSLERK